MRDGLEGASTASLTVIRDNMWIGLGEIGQRFINGTAHDQDDKVKGSASPAQFGACVVLPLFLKINTILVKRGEEDFTGRLS